VIREFSEPPGASAAIAAIPGAVSHEIKASGSVSDYRCAQRLHRRSDQEGVAARRCSAGESDLIVPVPGKARSQALLEALWSFDQLKDIRSLRKLYLR
jgi:hypothetical protein